MKVGAKEWGLGIVELTLDSQSHASFGMAVHVLNDIKLERIKRINPIVPRGMFSLTGTKRLEQLEGLGRDQAKHDKKNLEELFFTQKAEPFEPIYTLHGRRQCENPKNVK